MNDRLADDLRRFALAQGVAALDTYVRWVIADVPLTDMAIPLKSLEVPHLKLISLGWAVVANRERTKPRVRARHALERAILTVTFSEQPWS